MYKALCMYKAINRTGLPSSPPNTKTADAGVSTLLTQQGFLEEGTSSR